ncbi:hypothetical protein [Lysobacter sp. CA199]|uniref:hypothetical protein n=1 Tax=Lysobacter sp. CA199 TaxID=3455608 RepID=UPI003F8D2985
MSMFNNECADRAAQTALQLVTLERARQVTVKGYDFHHDDEHDRGQLAIAAAAYLLPLWLNPDVAFVENNGLSVLPVIDFIEQHTFGPFERHDGDYSETNVQVDLRVETLITGVALGLAEIERLLRLKSAMEANS